MFKEEKRFSSIAYLELTRSLSLLPGSSSYCYSSAYLELIRTMSRLSSCCCCLLLNHQLTWS